ncbi:MAG: PEP-CTERM sorting domain-containing protein [Phycisphaerae bacterium]
MRLSHFLAVAFTASAAVSASSFGNIISFDPDGPAAGNSAYQVASIDFLVGNSIAVNGLFSPASFTQLYQARLGSLLDAAGHVIPVPGLNSTFEITVVAGYTANGTVSGSGVGSTITSHLAPGNDTGFVKLYYHATSPHASDLNGTGFNDDHLIYTGTITSASAIFMITNGVSPLDLFSPAPFWAGNTTVNGIGGLSLSALTASYDSSFFTNGLNIMTVDANTSTALPYRETDPSKQFVNLNGSAYTPNIGGPTGTNGVTGTDILIQADANAAFTPEPASLGLLGLGAMGLLARRRRV